MNGIIGMTELALDTELTREQKEYLDAVRSSADAMLSVINDILDFSKIEARKLDVCPVNFRLRDDVVDTVSTLALRAHEKQLELACRIHPDVPDSVIGDSLRIRQIIVNLVGNAIKFTRQGEVVVEIGVDSRTKDSAVLHFAVRDTGIGVPADKQQIRFKDFLRRTAPRRANMAVRSRPCDLISVGGDDGRPYLGQQRDRQRQRIPLHHRRGYSGDPADARGSRAGGAQWFAGAYCR